MISRDDMMLIAAALRRTRPLHSEFITAAGYIGAHTTWLDSRAEIDRVLQLKCPTFDRRRFHMLTEITGVESTPTAQLREETEVATIIT